MSESQRSEKTEAEIPYHADAPEELVYKHHNSTGANNESGSLQMTEADSGQMSPDTDSESKHIEKEKEGERQDEQQQQQQPSSETQVAVNKEEEEILWKRRVEYQFQITDWDNVAKIPTVHFTFLIEMLLPRHIIARTPGKERELEDNVNQTLRTKYGGNPDARCISVGSSAEGYMIPSLLKIMPSCEPTGILYSDVDVLVEWNFSPLKETFIDCNESYVVETGDTHPGYARIHIANPEKALKDVDPSFAVVLDDKFYLSAMKPKQDMHGIAEDEASGPVFSEIKGPAIAMEDPTSLTSKFLASTTKNPNRQELVTAIPCDWLSVANEWKTRKRSNTWLRESTIDFVVNKGCHLVPVSHKKSDNPEVEWRISFATSEVHLAKTIVTEEQRQCYLYFKLLRKATMGEYDLLSSYHCKTVFLYSCERLPLYAWENTGACLLYMLDLLRSFVEKRFLPSYFIPENNLIDHFSEEDFELIEKILQQLRRDPIAPILEFTDKHRFAYQGLCVPFRATASYVLDDFEAYDCHRNIDDSLVSFTSSKDSMFYACLETNKIPDAVAWLFDLLPFFDRHFQKEQMGIYMYMYCAFLNCHLIMQLVQAFEKIISYSQEFPEVLLLRGHLANLYHCGALNFKVGTDDHKHLLEKAESLFTSVMSEEGRLSPATIDYACLLIAMGKLRQAFSCLVEFISNHQHVLSIQSAVYSRITYMVLGQELRDAIRGVIEEEAILSMPSLSLAHYLLIKCLTELPPRENSDIDLAINEFELHSESIRPANTWMHCLLGFALMKLERYQDAESVFRKIPTTSNDKGIAKTNTHICHVQYLVENDRAREAVQYLVDTAKRFYSHMSVVDFIDYIALSTTSPRYAVTLYDEITGLTNEYPDSLTVRGNMACMYHSCAYQYEEGSEEFLTFLVQAETLFCTMTIGDESAMKLASKIDYCGLLMSQERWQDVIKLLSEALQRDHDSIETNSYGRLELPSVDKNLQNEIQIHGNFAAKSLAFGFYFLVKSMLSLGTSFVELQGIVAKFKAFCEYDKDAHAYSLLGYTYMMLKQFYEAVLSFSRAVEKCRDYTVAKQNIAECQRELRHLGLPKYPFIEYLDTPCLLPDLEGDYTYDISKMAEILKQVYL